MQGMSIHFYEWGNSCLVHCQLYLFLWGVHMHIHMVTNVSLICPSLPLSLPCRPASTSSGKSDERGKSTLSHSLFASGTQDDAGDLFSPKSETVHISHTAQQPHVYLTVS